MQRKGRRYKSRWTKKVGIKQVRRPGVCEVCLCNIIETDLIVKSLNYMYRQTVEYGCETHKSRIPSLRSGCEIKKNSIHVPPFGKLKVGGKQ